MTADLQVLLTVNGRQTLVAGVPAVLRAAQRAAEELSPARFVLSGKDPGFLAAWKPQLASFAVGADLDPNIPLLAVYPGGVPAAAALKRFLEWARPAGRPAAWSSGGEFVAAYYPTAEEYCSKTGTVTYEAQPEDWISEKDPGFQLRAERDLYASLVKDTDGYVARFDRGLSIAISKLLLKTPITPNQITTTSFLLGLAGAAGVATGVYGWQVLGACVLWFCCLLDGCDGEVARLKLLCSSRGAAYDLIADHLAHLAIFVAIPFGVYRSRPQAPVALLGTLMVSGLAASMLTTWWLILRKEGGGPEPVRLFFERVASRDYVYLVLVLVLVQRLDWFLWTAGAGAYAFNLALWWYDFKWRRAP